MSLIVAISTLIAGCLMLAWGSDRFVSGASALASHFGLPPLFIGVVLIGFATSVPEMFVSAMASINGNPLLAIGNAFGSNIANLGLVLAIATIIMPLNILSSVLERLYPLLLLVYACILLILLDGKLSFNDGFILLAIFLVISIWMTLQTRKPQYKADPIIAETLVEVKTQCVSLKKAVIWWLVGLFVVLASAHFIVQSAVTIATVLGVSDVVIGLTVVAIGTSLPELAAAIAATFKNEPDLIVGNVIGSNLFNSLPVLMMPAFLSPTDIPHRLLQRDFSFMLVLAIAVILLGRKNSRGLQLPRWAGGILLLSYVAYVAALSIKVI